MSAVEFDYRLADVFGVSRSVPLSYVPRAYVDDRFVNGLTRDKHLVLFGGSKQGKTCLRRHCLQEDDYIVVQCANGASTAQLYAAILKEAGATVSVGETKSVRGERKVSVEFGASGGLSFIAKADGKGGYDRVSGTETSTERRHFEIEASDPNDVIRILKSVGFARFIVLEDYHYLDEDVQRQIAMDLKAFHEKSDLCFIIVGVWLEANRLSSYNGDLAGRLVTIDVDRWQTEDLNRVIATGEGLLNVRFDEMVRAAILDSAGGNVGLLQEICHKLCESQRIARTQALTVSVGTVQAVRDTVAGLAKEQSGRYETFLAQFATGFTNDEAEMYRWIALMLVDASEPDLRLGISVSEVLSRLKIIHPLRDKLGSKNVVQALKKIASLQHKNSTRPPVLDFDLNEQMLRVVDAWFPLFVRTANRAYLRNQLGLTDGA